MKVSTSALGILFSLAIMLAFVHPLVHAQPSRIQSLKKKVANTEEKNRINLYDSLADAYLNIQLDSSIAYAQKVIQKTNEETGLKAKAFAYYLYSLAVQYKYNNDLVYAPLLQAQKLYIQLGDMGGQVNCLANLGFYFLGKSQTEKATRLTDSAFSMAIKNQLTNERAYTLITKASIQLTLSADSNCLLSLRQALSLNSKQFDPIVEVNALNSITTYYSYIGSYDSCAWYFNKSTSISRSKGFLFPLQNILLNYSYTLKYQSKISKALEMAFEARNLADSIGSEYLASATDLQISSLYSGMNLYKKALEYLVPAIQVFEKNKINYELAYAYTRVAGLYLVTNDTVRAKRYLDSGEQLSKKNNDMVALSGNYATYAEYYLALNNRVGALQTLKKLVPLDKQLFGNNGEANAAVRLGLCMKESSDSELIAAGLSPIHAEQQILEYMKLGIRYADISKQRDAFKYLSEYYDRHGNMLLAFEHYKKYVLLNDSLQESQSKDQFLKLQTEFDEKNRAKERSLMTKNQQLQKQEIERQRLLRNFFIGGFILMCLFSIVFFRQRNRIKMEMGKSENLLLNILPAEIAHELKEFGTAEARHFNEVSVLFTDFKNFSTIAEQLTPSELVQKIDSYFKEFDRICMSMGIEKIKTIGDSYMCVAGLPLPDPMHAEHIITAAMAINQLVLQRQQEDRALGIPVLEMRLGIHSGPVVAGIVGLKKFAYDVWGDTVNIASRMESSGEPGKINISGETYVLIKDKYRCSFRGKIEAKNKGLIDMYFVEGKKV